MFFPLFEMIMFFSFAIFLCAKNKNSHFKKSIRKLIFEAK